MGYLDKSTITVDAILTNRGRELLADSNANNFRIIKFALADDEVDYRLYTTAHPLGSNYYGAVIENMPVLEATPDEAQALRYKLITITGDDLTKYGAVIIPLITTGNAGVTEGVEIGLSFNPQNSSNQGTQLILSPQTSYTSATAPQIETYTIQVADARLVDVLASETVGATGTLVAPNNRGSVTATGKFFTLRAKDRTGKTSVTIFGQETGATLSFTISTTAA